MSIRRAAMNGEEYERAAYEHGRRATRIILDDYVRWVWEQRITPEIQEQIKKKLCECGSEAEKKSPL